MMLTAKKEAKRLEKEAKLAAKAAKATVANAIGVGDKKVKDKAQKEKKDEVEVPFVNTTPKGHKKGKCVSVCSVFIELTRKFCCTQT